VTGGGPLPLGLFATAGAGAGQISPLLWGLIWLSVVIAVLIALAVVVGIAIRARRERDPKLVPVSRSGNGLPLIYGGVGLSILILLALTGWTVTVIAGIAKPSAPAAFSVDVSARQWWWAFHYDDPDSGKAFTTANELHIPVGQAVAFNLTSPDVIHSFWVPALGGKTDVIPGQTNTMWLEADKAGVYRGQCSEYCGQQHANMALYVVAEPAAQYASWRTVQAAPAKPPVTAQTEAGLADFIGRCGNCHTVRGTPARGDKGPDLTHLMSRSTIAAGLLDNAPGNLAGWIAHPQGLKPGSLMPDIALSGPEFEAILAYVETLK